MSLLAQRLWQLIHLPFLCGQGEVIALIIEFKVHLSTFSSPTLLGHCMEVQRVKVWDKKKEGNLSWDKKKGNLSCKIR